MKINAIPVRYDNILFRSRLEAQWAYYFDLQQMPWQYEPVGFRIDHSGYLPDFYLPQQECWVEVKGPAFAKDAYFKATEISTFTSLPILILNQHPKNRAFELIYPNQEIKLVYVDPDLTPINHQPNFTDELFEKTAEFGRWKPPNAAGG